MIISDKWYNILKWVGSIACPALAVFVKTICQAMGWSWGEVASTILVATGVLICSLLQTSSAMYYQKKSEDIGG